MSTAPSEYRQGTASAYILIAAARYTGEITYTPITTTSPASMYWGINQDVTYGQNGTSLLSGNAGIVDTGTTLLLIATDAFQKYQQATGATLDKYVAVQMSVHPVTTDPSLPCAAPPAC